MEVIRKLKAYKLKSGKTQEDMAREMKISVFMISRLFNRTPKKIHATTKLVIESYLQKQGE